MPISEGFYNKISVFESIKERFPWGKSAIICLYDYSKFKFPESMQGKYAKAFFLSPENGKNDGYDTKRFESLLEEKGIKWGGKNDFPLRYGAMKAGLGVIRENNFLYTENGSYLTLIGYVIDSECSLIHEVNLRPCPKTCGLCRKGCKTKALMAAYTLNPMSCVSFWTTFGKGHVPEHLEEDMFEEWVCGCDNCQDVCPFNRRHNWSEGEDFSNLDEVAPMIEPHNLVKQTEEYLEKNVIPKTDDHLQPDESYVLYKSAERVIRYQEKYKK